jgi:hypothetical protein
MVEFQGFVERREPVVIEGALDAWKAPSCWTFERLRSMAGDLVVTVQARYGDGPDDFDYTKVPFARFLESVQNGAGRDYLGFRLLDEIPALWSEVTIPQYASRLTASPRAFIGPRGSFAPLHFDLAHGLSAQIAGRKKVVVLEFPLRDVARHRDLRRPGRLIEGLDVERLPACGIAGSATRRWECTLEPRDLLFLPSCRHHFLRSLDATISLSFFWHTASMKAVRSVFRLFGGPVPV